MSALLRTGRASLAPPPLGAIEHTPFTMTFGSPLLRSRVGADNPLVRTQADFARGASITTTAAEVVAYARRVDTNIAALGKEFRTAYATTAPTPTGNFQKDYDAYLQWKAAQPKIIKDWSAYWERWQTFKYENFDLTTTGDIKDVAAWGGLDSTKPTPPLWFHWGELFDEIAAFDVEYDKWSKTFTESTGKKLSTPAATVTAKEVDAKVKAVQGEKGITDYLKSGAMWTIAVVAAVAVAAVVVAKAGSGAPAAA